MSSTRHERYAAGRVAPTQSTVPGLGVTRIATSTTAAALDLSPYPHLFGKRLLFKNESTTAGDAIHISFSLDGGTAISAAASAGATVAAGTTKDQAFKLLPGEQIEWVLCTHEHKFLHMDALANTPTLCIYPSGRGTRRP